jgi:hypothetical protein
MIQTRADNFTVYSIEPTNLGTPEEAKHSVQKG